MKILLVLFLLSATVSGQSPSPSDNWSEVHYRDTTSDPYRSGHWVVHPRATEIGFSFTLTSAERQTSAAVYDSDGTLVRTLWMGGAYAAGTYGYIWDGLDDYGKRASGSSFTIKVAYNNIDYHWDGIIGSTENSWSGPYNWDASTPSFIRSAPAFLNGKAYAAGGYGEGRANMPVFDEGDPNGDVVPLNPYATSGQVMFSVTDGKLIYYGLQTFSGGGNPPHSGVIAYYPAGQPYSFRAGSPLSARDISSNQIAFNSHGALALNPFPGVKIVDASALPGSQITGIAVERGGKFLATAHGYYDPSNGSGGAPIASQDKVYLWDKTTGAALGSFSVPNPQQMAFDQKGNLWIISGMAGNGGGDTLFEVSRVGSSNTLSSPIAGLEDPVAVAVSPTTGNIFVADGGEHQQIYEYDATSHRQVSTLGVRGGYGRGSTCNATIDPGGHDNPTFWFDPNVLKDRKVPANSPFVNWISISDKGDLWVGDLFTTRILHYAWTGRKWKFVDRITFLPWNYFYAISDPTRLFSGPTGFLEYRVNYSVPLQPGDPEVNGDKGAWDIVRNWLPCVEAQLPEPNSQYAGSAILTTGDGNTLLYPNSLTLGVALLVPRSGVLSYKLLSHPLSGYTVFDPMGNDYGSTVSRSGSRYTYTVQRYTLTGIDADGFPEWGAATPIGTYTADIAEGNPQLTQAAFTWWPSSGDIIPVYSTSYNATVNGTTPAFHLGGLPIGGHALQWQTMPQKSMEWVDGDGSFPSVDLAGVAQAGANTFAINRDIFTFYNGNWNPWACQFSHFRDDGLFLGQFGFRTSYGYGHNLNTYGNPGYPVESNYPALPLAPGFCGDASLPKFVQVGTDYYAYVGDEAYRHGTHRWHISNLSSLHESAATAMLGSTVQLSPIS